jgi:hypothetical protein
LGIRSPDLIASPTHAIEPSADTTENLLPRPRRQFFRRSGPQLRASLAITGKLLVRKNAEGE